MLPAMTSDEDGQEVVASLDQGAALRAIMNSRQDMDLSVALRE